MIAMLCNACILISSCPSIGCLEVGSNNIMLGQPSFMIAMPRNACLLISSCPFIGCLEPGSQNIMLGYRHIVLHSEDFKRAAHIELI